MKHAAIRFVIELAKLFTSIDEHLLQRRSGTRAELGAANQSIQRLQVESEFLRARCSSGCVSAYREPRRNAR